MEMHVEMHMGRDVHTNYPWDRSQKGLKQTFNILELDEYLPL